MPMFLIAPPKPVISCPLKWVRLMNTSASMIARPILAAWTYSPPTTGTSMSSVPLSPSPMRIGQPTVSGVNPFSQGAVEMLQGVLATARGTWCCSR